MPSTAQPAPETDEKKSRGLGSYVVWTFVAVMVYVLSSGPACTLAGRGILSGEFMLIYFPVFFAYQRTPLHKPIGLYLHLFDPKTFDRNGETISP